MTPEQLHPELDKIGEKLRRTATEPLESDLYLLELLEETNERYCDSIGPIQVNADFATQLYGALCHEPEPEWTIYAARNIFTLTYPGDTSCGVVVGNTVEHTTEYRAYAEPVLRVLIATFRAVERDLKTDFQIETDESRKFRLRNIDKGTFKTMMEIFGLLVYDNGH